MAQKTTAARKGATRAPIKVERRPEVTLPLVGRVIMPPPDRIAFYVALGALAAVEIIEWPVALIIGFGHFLAEQHFSRVLQAVGEAAEAA
ncbi:hypothetical protein [Sphaerisporangium perillae]|uniref:hypothetical protein n=1 Tax=Sphaerisporangium perillae TaxID=2935860 RepID=UPI00200E983E|nr:hypothetical protein [Sphaerisporangium perillae]